MHRTRKIWLGLLASLAAVMVASMPSAAQQKPNILVIMGDDVGWFNVGVRFQGTAVFGGFSSETERSRMTRLRHGSHLTSLRLNPSRRALWCASLKSLQAFS
jgi:hypothetical protein